MLKQTVRYKAIEPLRAAAPQARLRYMLDRPSILDEQTAALGSLVLASGLEFVLGGGSGRQTRDALVRMQQMLKTDLQALVVGVESGVAQIVLSPRR
jgi:hypothetical protein